MPEEQTRREFMRKYGINHLINDKIKNAVRAAYREMQRLIIKDGMPGLTMIAGRWPMEMEVGVVRIDPVFSFGLERFYEPTQITVKDSGIYLSPLIPIKHLYSHSDKKP